MSLLVVLMVAGKHGLGSELPTSNPWLADSPYAISHHNPAQTDSTEIDGPRKSKQLTLQDVKTVPLVWCSAPTYKRIGDDTVVIASNPTGLIKIRASGEDFIQVSNVPYPGREQVHAAVSTDKIFAAMANIDENRRKKQD